MQKPKGSQTTGPDHLEWYLLADYVVSEMMPKPGQGEQLAAGLLSQACQEFGVPFEILKSIERSLIEFAREAILHFDLDRLDSTIHVRLFCPQKTWEEIKSAKTSRQLNAEPAPQPDQITRHSDTKIKGGWGYFFIERGRGLAPGCSAGTNYLIDLYLYQEGE